MLTDNIIKLFDYDNFKTFFLEYLAAGDCILLDEEIQEDNLEYYCNAL